MLRAKKEAIINGDANFEDALYDALNYQTIEKHPQRISKLKRYINKYNWKGTEFQARAKEWIKFEKNNKTVAHNVLHIPRNTKTINLPYRSEYNDKRKKQVILLMISNGKKQHYLAITNLSALLEGNSLNHKEEFFV